MEESCGFCILITRCRRWEYVYLSDDRLLYATVVPLLTLMYITAMEQRLLSATAQANSSSFPFIFATTIGASEE
jgi:hypothetical protein